MLVCCGITCFDKGFLGRVAESHSVLFSVHGGEIAVFHKIGHVNSTI